MMAAIVYLVAALCVASAAPPPHLYRQPAQLQQISPLDYYIDNPDVEYYQPEHKRGNVKALPDNVPSRLETLEPDSEVELIPGAQPPQQPPQQTPVAPNIPGLIPGQRVFIVHMPVPGIRPGTVGGYQPVYIVAAAPQANSPYPGYQNTILLDPSGQPVSPYLGYPMQGGAGVQGNPNLVFSGSAYSRPFGLAYQHPGLNYHQVPAQQAAEAPESAFRVAQRVILETQQAQVQAQEPPSNAEPSDAKPKSASQVIADSKEASVEPSRNTKSSQKLTKDKA